MSPPTLQFSYPYSPTLSLLNYEPLLWHAGHCVPFSYNHALSRSTGTPSTSWRRQSSNQPVSEYGNSSFTTCNKFNACSSFTTCTKFNACYFIISGNCARSECPSRRRSQQTARKRCIRNISSFADFDVCSCGTRCNGTPEPDGQPARELVAYNIFACTKSSITVNVGNPATDGQPARERVAYNIFACAKSSITVDVGNPATSFKYSIKYQIGTANRNCYSFRIYSSRSTSRIKQRIR